MSGAAPRLLVCTCEKTMPLDGDALAKGCGGRIDRADQLCGAQIEMFKAAPARRKPRSSARSPRTWARAPR
jgi:hypothetical protein